MGPADPGPAPDGIAAQPCKMLERIEALEVQRRGTLARLNALEDRAEGHAASLVNHLKRIVAIERGHPPDGMTMEQLRARLRALEVNPDPSVRAPLDRIRFRCTQDQPALICDLCRMTCVELVRIDGQFDLCDSCIDKLERALGVSG